MTVDKTEILDRLPKGRDEDDGWQLWLRRHHEYDNGRLGHRTHGRAREEDDDE